MVPLLPDAAHDGKVTEAISAIDGSENDAVILYANKPLGKLSPITFTVVNDPGAGMVTDSTVKVVASAGMAINKRQNPMISILIHF